MDFADLTLILFLILNYAYLKGPTEIVNNYHLFEMEELSTAIPLTQIDPLLASTLQSN